MRLGLLTSGGDCAGLNAVIRAVVTRAVLGHGWQVLGIRQATHGLLSRPVDAVELTPDSVAGVLNLGGTLLGTTNRDNPFAYPAKDGGAVDRSAVVAAGYHELGLDALIGVGGDGSLSILRRLAEQDGWKLVGIPKTIDNDVRHTEHAIGFNSAVAIATEAVDRLHVTAASHSRVMVLLCGRVATPQVACSCCELPDAGGTGRIVDVEHRGLELGSVGIVPPHGVVVHWLHYVMDVSRAPPGVRPQADVDLVRMG